MITYFQYESSPKFKAFIIIALCLVLASVLYYIGDYLSFKTMIARLDSNLHLIQFNQLPR